MRGGRSSGNEDAPSLEALVESGAVRLASLHPGGLRLTAELADACRISAGARVLDVACGTGETACFLAAERDAEVSGLDRSAALLARARDKAAAGRLSVRFHQGDAHSLPFPDATFDAVLCECTLCLLDKVTVLAEMVRVVRPGGRVGIHDLCWQTNAPASLRRRLAALEGESPETLAGWQRLLERAGLTDVAALDRSALKDRWMRDSRRQIGPVGQLRLGVQAIRRWGLTGLWKILRSERVFASGHLGYALVVGTRPDGQP